MSSSLLDALDVWSLRYHIDRHMIELVLLILILALCRAHIAIWGASLPKMVLLTQLATAPCLWPLLRGMGGSPYSLYLSGIGKSLLVAGLRRKADIFEVMTVWIWNCRRTAERGVEAVLALQAVIVPSALCYEHKARVPALASLHISVSCFDPAHHKLCDRPASIAQLWEYKMPLIVNLERANSWELLIHAHPLVINPLLNPLGQRVCKINNSNVDLAVWNICLVQ